jgi:hypothetical protein
VVRRLTLYSPTIPPSALRCHESQKFPLTHNSAFKYINLLQLPSYHPRHIKSNLPSSCMHAYNPNKNAQLSPAINTHCHAQSMLHFPVPKRTPMYSDTCWYADLISYIFLMFFARLLVIAFSSPLSMTLPFTFSFQEILRPPPPPSRLGTAFLPTLFPGRSIRGTPEIILGSLINATSSCAGILDTTVL